MPWGLKRFHQTCALHFVTWSCEDRQPLLNSSANRDLFLKSKSISISHLFEHSGRIRCDAGACAFARIRASDWKHSERHLCCESRIYSEDPVSKSPPLATPARSGTPEVGW